jgi:hypothetical protein
MEVNVEERSQATKYAEWNSFMIVGSGRKLVQDDRRGNLSRHVRGGRRKNSERQEIASRSSSTEWQTAKTEADSKEF